MNKLVTILSLVLIAFTAGAQSASSKTIQQIICKSENFAVKLSNNGQSPKQFMIVSGQVQGQKIIDANRMGQRVCDINLDSRGQLKSLSCAYSQSDELPTTGTFLMIGKDDENKDSFQFIQKVLVNQENVQSKMNQELAYDLKCSVN